MDTSCLYTTVRNTSGVTKKFSFLPPNGRSLDANQEITFLGTIVEAIQRFKRRAAERHLQALERSLLAGDITIISSPSPILYDAASDKTSIIVLDGGTLALADPCWGISASL